MQYFFDVPETIPKGFGFTLFGINHIVRLVIAALLVITAVFLYKKLKKYRQRLIMRRIVSISGIALIIIKMALVLLSGKFSPKQMPFTLCELFMMAAFYHTNQPNERTAELLFAVGLPASVLALLCPLSRTLPILNYQHIYFFVLPILLLSYCAMLLSAKEITPQMKKLPYSAAVLLGISAVLYGYDKLTGANFLYLREPLSDGILARFAGYLGNPGYLAGACILTLLLWELMYLPYNLKEKREPSEHVRKKYQGKR